MGTIIVIGAFVLLVIGAYLVQRKFDKLTQKDTTVPPVAELTEEGKKTIKEFTRSHGAPGSGTDHSGIAPIGTAIGGTSIPDARQCQEDYEKGKRAGIKAESGEALRRKIEKHGAHAVYDTPALETIASRKAETVEGVIRKATEDAIERTGGEQKFHKLDESKSIEDQYEQQQQLDEEERNS